MYFCKSCGEPFINEDAYFCENCGMAKNSGNKFCYNCGSPVGESEEICQVCGVTTGNYVSRNNTDFAGFGTNYQGMNGYGTNPYETGAYGSNPYGAPYTPSKSRIVAGLLAIFLGFWGVHNFYLGNTKTAVTQLVLTIVGHFLICFGIGILITFGTWIWGLAEGVMLLSGKIDVDGQGRKLIG